MDNNALALFQLLKTNINQTTPDLTDKQFERDALLRLAKKHDVAAIICCQLQLITPQEPQDYKKDFLQGFAGTVIRYVRMTEAQKRLSSLLAEAGIEHIYFKGTVIAQYYPVPELRTMGDIDVLVRLKDRDKAISILMTHGAVEVESSLDVSEYIFDGVPIELHTNMIHEEIQIDFCFRDYFAAAWDHAAPTAQPFVWQLEPTFHLIYVIAHLAKHFHDRGCGVRMFMDIAVLMDKQKNALDLKSMMRQLERMHLDRFFKRLLFLNRLWFGQSSEIPDEEISEEAFEAVTEYVISGGVFGYDATPLENVALRKLYHENQAVSIHSASTKLFFRTVFPSNKQLGKLGYVPSLINRKMLIPLAWLYRWFYSLFTRSEHTKNRIRQLTSVSEEKVQQILRQELIIQNMGL